MTCSVQSREQLNLLEEDIQLYELLTTRYAGSDSGVTRLSGNISPVITETAVISGVAMSAPDENVKISLWLSAG